MSSGVITPKRLLIALAVFTCALALVLPPDPHTLQTLHISSLAYRIAILVLLIPYGIVWTAAIYAFTKLHTYSKKITGTKDGKAFRSIMIGTGVLALGLILPTAVSLVTQNIASHNASFKPAAAIITNYVGLVAALSASIYMNNGAHLLAKLSGRRPSLAGTRIFALLFIALTLSFTYLVINYHNKHDEAYYLNTPLLVATFIIPALFTWFIALLSAYEIGLYSKYVKGVLYRQALRRFAYGLVVVIASTVANQFLATTIAADASHSLASVLLLDYALLAMYVLGSILMALGAKKLIKIEEV